MTVVVDPRTASIAVIGVGTRYRHDDGVGRVVADRIGALGLSGVRVSRCDGDPAELMDALSGPPWAIVVGVISARTPCPGRLHRIDIGARSLTPPVRTSQHGLGVLDAVALARALGRLPDRLLLLGVEAADLTPGVGFSLPVVAALPGLVALTRASLDEPGEIVE